jgi:hypothetical protein
VFCFVFTTEFQNGFCSSTVNSMSLQLLASSPIAVAFELTISKIWWGIVRISSFNLLDSFKDCLFYDKVSQGFFYVNHSTFHYIYILPISHSIYSHIYICIYIYTYFPFNFLFCELVGSPSTRPIFRNGTTRPEVKSKERHSCFGRF